ncbi:MAG: helix-turn-helix domain-containing protein [Ekhidna sp.]
MNFLFLFASLGVINGLIVSIYLFTKKERSVSEIYFAGLIFTLCIRIGKSVVHSFFPDTDKMVLQLGLSACIFIGPFFYLYLKSIREQQSKFNKKDLGLLAILLVGISVFGILFPYKTYTHYWNPETVQVIYFVWAIFIVLGVIQSYKIVGSSLFTFWKLKGEQQYLMVIVIGVAFITLTYQFALFVGFTYLWGSFIFSILFYVLAFRALTKGKSIAPKPIVKKLNNGEGILDKVNRVMEQDKLYLRQDLKLEDIANKTAITRHILSQVLNDVYGHGYAHYIKEMRISEAKKLIETRSDLSLEGIGYEAGFKSKSVFFESFKKIVGCTPSAYKKEVDGK